MLVKHHIDVCFSSLNLATTCRVLLLCLHNPKNAEPRQTTPFICVLTRARPIDDTNQWQQKVEENSNDNCQYSFTFNTFTVVYS